MIRGENVHALCVSIGYCDDDMTPLVSDVGWGLYGLDCVCYNGVPGHAGSVTLGRLGWTPWFLMWTSPVKLRLFHWGYGMLCESRWARVGPVVSIVDTRSASSAQDGARTLCVVMPSLPDRARVCMSPPPLNEKADTPVPCQGELRS